MILIVNSVYEYVHKQEIKKVKEEGIWSSSQLETIVHPNDYFKRSYLLKNYGKAPSEDREKELNMM